MRKRNLFDPQSIEPFVVSRSKIGDFLECPRCFYLDRRLGISQPPGPPFSLNSAVDALLKKEFDLHRARGTRHRVMEEYGVDAVPFAHAAIDEWRENFKGVRFVHPATNLEISGAVDDVWVNSQGELIIVDYKSTAKSGEVELTNAPWHEQYKRQMEVYQWLLRCNGFAVSDTGYFVYCNGDLNREAFDGVLEFRIKLIPYTGVTDWIESTLLALKACLMSTLLPDSGPDCVFCQYRQEAQEIEAMVASVADPLLPSETAPSSRKH